MDHDGTVTAFDMQIMQQAMDSRPGDANWNPVCDLDRNNDIDQQDLLILVQEYAK